MVKIAFYDVENLTDESVLPVKVVPHGRSSSCFLLMQRLQVVGSGRFHLLKVVGCLAQKVEVV